MIPFLFIQAKQLKWVAFLLFSVCLFLLSLHPESDQPVISTNGPMKAIYAGQDGISLTVNADQQDQNIGKLVKLLIENETTASFFVTSSWLEHHPKTTKLLVDRAFDIGVLITDSSNEDVIVQEINAVKKILSSHGKINIVFLRAADGVEQDGILRVAESNGYLPVQWSVDLRNRPASSFVENAKKGDIVLLNLDSDQQVTKKMISILSAKETPISLSEMIGGRADIQYIP
ncbi:polysaccharide deacetylase family protein [Domibacillus epiphyticus]|uniref:NodB homology domain-containing protein n=1 Tax=Domibacillus epiphyticus TaxID=1714355 RepID=A0A1V2AA95_9BACI|nr:polysaccharide deacetylase family protein [Domibacillus epiphyticus]OMP67911.1 hypothetical protein BTO28_04215 [Domibacillus epiphyticus]